MKSVHRTYKTMLLGYVFIIIALLSCNQSSDEGGVDGILNIIMIDTPARIKHLNVDIEDVSIHHSGSAADVGWVVVNKEPIRNLDLLSLRNGKFSQLVLSRIATGKYDKIKIQFGPCTITENETPVQFEYNSVIQYGYTLNYNFEISGSDQCELAFDIDVYKSTSKVGSSYYFNPVLRVQDVKLTGWIQGAVIDSNRIPIFATIQTTVVGEIVTTLNDTIANGSFVLSGLPAAMYSIRVMPFDTALYREVSIDSIIVKQKEKNNIGQIILRP